MAKAKQVVPTSNGYAVQANQLLRAAHKMPVMQRRLIYLAMAQARPGDKEFELVEMTVGDIVRALGLSDQGNRYEEIRAAARGVMQEFLDLDTDYGWIMHHWVRRVRYIKTRDAIQIHLEDELRPYVLDLQKAFSVIQIADISRLQGKYALRIFEFVMSYQGLAGTGGNKPGTWYVDLMFDHLRTLFRIGPKEYTPTNNFRKWVIDAPVREINDADIGIRIECDYDRHRRGRRLLGVRLQCRLTSRHEPRNVSPATLSETEEDQLVNLNQDLLARLVADEPTDLFGGELARMANAIAKLKTHPEAVQPPRKRGRPRGSKQ